MLRYKIDVMAALKDAGYSSYRIRKENLFGQQTIRNIREGKPISWDALGKLCDLLRCDIADLVTASPTYLEGEGKTDL